jgi:hypothetical protein
MGLVSSKKRSNKIGLINSYLNEYILKGREIKKQDEEDFDLFGISKPCQINVIFFREPTVVVILFTHLPDLPDLHFEIYGPYYSSKSVKILTNILHESTIYRSYINNIANNPKSKVIVTFEDEFIDVIKTIQYLIETGEPSLPVIRSISMLHNATLWISEGFLPNLNLDDLYNELGLKENTSSDKKDKYIRGWGAFFYPPVVTYRKKNVNLSKKIISKNIENLHNKDYIGDINTYKYIMEKMV